MSSVKTADYMKNHYNATVALADKVIASDAIMEIEGFEELSLLIKQFPWPVLSPGGEIEVPTPNGGVKWQAQNVKVNQQGQITFMETEKGHIQKLLEDLISKGGTFNARMFEGSRENPSNTAKIVDCFFQSDNPDRDWENRAQIMTISGTLFFHYFGEK